MLGSKKNKNRTESIRAVEVKRKEIDAVEDFLGKDMLKVILRDNEPHNVSEYNIPLVARIATMKELGINQAEFEILEAKFLNFMFVAKHGEYVKPCKKINVLWHHLISDTRNYMEFCAEHLGFYLHQHIYIHSYDDNFDVELVEAIGRLSLRMSDKVEIHKVALIERFGKGSAKGFPDKKAADKRSFIELIDRRNAS